MNCYDALSKEELLEKLKLSEKTKIKYVNKYLEQEEKWNILRLLLAKISHEFKTPLNSIIGFSDLLLARLDDEKELEFVNNISISSRHMLDLIQDLLDLTRSQYKPLELNYEFFSAKDVILDIIRSYPNVCFDYTLLDVDIEADGGINIENVESLKEAGCDIIVAGTSIINSENYKETIEQMKK